MVRYISKVLLPWCQAKKEQLNLPSSQKTVAILDVYRAHRTPDVLKVFEQCGFMLVFVPGNCTSEMLPLDLTINRIVMEDLQNFFMDWYAGKVSEAQSSSNRDTKCAVSAVNPDLRLSTLKPAHAEWVVKILADVSSRHNVIRAGWKQASMTLPEPSHTSSENTRPEEEQQRR